MFHDTTLFTSRNTCTPALSLKSGHLLHSPRISFPGFSKARSVESSQSKYFTTFCVTGESPVTGSTEQPIGLFGAPIKQETLICASNNCTKNTVFQPTQLHLISGDIVRIQPNHLSFSSLAAVDDIHGLRTPSGKASQYTQIMRINPKAGPENIFNTVYISPPILLHSKRA